MQIKRNFRPIQIGFYLIYALIWIYIPNGCLINRNVTIAKVIGSGGADHQNLNLMHRQRHNIDLLSNSLTKHITVSMTQCYNVISEPNQIKSNLITSKIYHIWQMDGIWLWLWHSCLQIFSIEIEHFGNCNKSTAFNLLFQMLVMSVVIFGLKGCEGGPCL